MFSFGSKVKQKLTATRFEFSFVVHNLAPWPEGSRAIAIGYQRGKRRRGATRSIYPSRQPGRLGAVVRFNERFDMPVTLYKANSGNAVGNGGLGPFKKKCLILAVLETDGRTQATAALGRVVVDLSEFAAVEHQETRTFMVSCNKAIHAAVGDPQLMVTIRCRWKKMRDGGPGGAATGLPDETASMSTDTTGSRMTANLSSFLRFKFTGKGTGLLNDEQDLRGFESSGGGVHSSGGAAGGGRGPASVAGDAPGLPKVMDTIQESHDEPVEPSAYPAGGGSGITPLHSGSRGPTPATSVKQLTPSSVGPIDSSPRSSQQRHPAGGDVGGEPVRGTLEGSVVGLSLRELHAARNRQNNASAAPSAGSRVDLLGSGLVEGAASSRPYSAAPSLTPAGSNHSLPTAVADNDLLAALRFELLTAAALESAVYLARRPPGAGLSAPGGLTGAIGGSFSGASGTGLSSNSKGYFGSAGRGPGGVGGAGRAAHAPSRRLMRTVLGLGPSDGPQFGAAALRVVRAQVAAAGEVGIEVVSYWWSNVVHLRAMLASLQLSPGAGGLLLMRQSSMSGTSTNGAGAGDHWASSALLPELRRIERGFFEEVLSRMWERVLLPTVLGTATVGGRLGAAGVAAKPSTAVTKRAQQEAAIKRWFEALEAVCTALSRQMAPAGHAGLLRHQVLLQCLKRVDMLLFAHLLGGVEQPGVLDLLTDYDPHRSLTSGTPGTPVAAAAAGASVGSSSFPQLEDSNLPFARGVLTFGGGMSVKMTVTRLQQWAAAHPALGGAAAPGSGFLDVTSDRMGGGGGNGPGVLGPLFPLLRAAADLLMMPKELLLDQAVRLDVGAALSMRSVLHILERFKPDEFAQDSISPAILASLQHDAALPQMHLRSAAADLNSGYMPPSDGQVLRAVETGCEPGLEYDGDSEDELEELAQVVAKSSAAAPSSGFAVGAAGGAGGAAGGPPLNAVRFRLLHELWAAGLTRRRGPYSVASETN